MLTEKYYLQVGAPHAPGAPYQNVQTQENLLRIFPDHDWTQGPPPGFRDYQPPKMYIEMLNNIPTGTGFPLQTMMKRFPNHDFASGPPEGFAEYFPQAIPPLQKYFTAVRGEMRVVDGKVYDDVTIRPMTQQEKEIHIEILKRNYYEATGNLSWTFDTETMTFNPPFSPSNAVNGGQYRWVESTKSWELINQSEG